jgi:hypothetical protein
MDAAGSLGMSDRWAASLPVDRSGEALRLWRRPGVEVCAADGRLWLRGERRDEELMRQLRSMLGGERFDSDGAGLVTPAECSLPTDRLPSGPWASLASYFRLVPPRRDFAARAADGVAIQLVPSGAALPCQLLKTPLTTWTAYAEQAPAVRLARWSFAVSDAFHALVRGAPLPSLPGVAFVERGGIAVPAGWTWAPPLDAAVLRRALALRDGDLALFAANGTHEILAADCFVQATRSAVRLTARAAAC